MEIVCQQSIYACTLNYRLSIETFQPGSCENFLTYLLLLFATLCYSASGKTVSIQRKVIYLLSYCCCCSRTPRTGFDNRDVINPQDNLPSFSTYIPPTVGCRYQKQLSSIRLDICIYSRFKRRITCICLIMAAHSDSDAARSGGIT